MRRRFNVSGQCFPERHYMLPPLPRAPGLRGLIEDQAYFVLHAPRQSGKSTVLRTMAEALTAEGRYAALMVSVEPGVPFPDDVGVAEQAILRRFRSSAEAALAKDLQPPPFCEAPPGARIAEALKTWSQACPRPLVLFIDEIDALSGETLISVLRQLREGYSFRPRHFPWALGLCGLSGGSERMNSASPFNIKDDSFTLRNFTREEVAALYAQHTAETGQVFVPAAVDQAYDLCCGQPWLVNALARQCVDVLVIDRQQPICAEHVLQAKELLIQRRDTHLDSLAERLREPRVRRIIEPILTGAVPPMDIMDDDMVYARDIGLIVDRPSVRIANKIYQEMIPRALTFVMQGLIPNQTAWYLRDDGTLDMVLLLASCLEFFAQHSEAWLGRFDYKEAGPHLILMAFLQRVINGGGRITREFALGSGRADLVVEFGGGRAVIELKLRQGEHTRREGIEQLCAYLDRLGEREGHLVIFDRRKGLSFADKLCMEEVEGKSGQRVFLYGA